MGGEAEGGLGLHLHQPPAGRHPVALGGSVCNNNIVHRKSIRNVRAGIKDMEERMLYSICLIFINIYTDHILQP